MPRNDSQRGHRGRDQYGIGRLEQSQFDALLKALAKAPNEAALEPQLKDLFEAFEQ